LGNDKEEPFIIIIAFLIYPGVYLCESASDFLFFLTFWVLCDIINCKTCIQIWVE